ncbi:hypothetical protein ERJ75_000728500 [Trypanosoma vivax]|uniref:Uncharacterized protein n=1 Tax=Trypanosoma vivax (strain Y486) TaxID=1055687 RepID=G0TX43_TRYVY|nr:hypothetical protein TRVL_07084 [Trypanosoma vivax]KAH8613998.1 hypothetical protein ERJ75_000728500 [Trypanosoma vivax]CCC48533.1 conserved hypothetical protein [Trypanosoma vivax Y486]
MTQVGGIQSRFEVQGLVSSMAHGSSSPVCLVSTIMNGAHIFSPEGLADTCVTTSQSTICVESFPHNIIGEDPVISSRFVLGDSCFAVGSAVGSIAVVSRQSRSVVRCYTFQDGAGVLSLGEVPGEPSLLVSCSQAGVQVVDMEQAALRLTLSVPKARVVGSVAVSSSIVVVANYDGKVMLYDMRKGSEPVVVLVVPDQITSVSPSTHLGAVAVGTVSGRVFILRCSAGSVREEAFAIGKERAPIRSLSVYEKQIAAGDICGKLTLLDCNESPSPTRQWSAQMLLPPLASQPPFSAAAAQETGDNSLWSVSGVALQKDILWAALSSTGSTSSHVVVLPL